MKPSRRNIRKLERSKPSREPRQRFILFCEGKNTEVEYFNAIDRACTSASISVEPRGGEGVPYTIAEKAIEYAKTLRRGQRNSYEERDQVWAVFDRDDHPHFNEAVAYCQSNKVGVGRSNPCIELWLILHEQDFDRYEDRHAMQKILAKLRPEYDPDGAKTLDCDDLVKRVEVAEQRSETQLQRRVEEDNPNGNPSTTVGQLIREIREANARAARPDNPW